MNEPVKKRVKGYMASYEASLSRLEDAKRTECERLSREWSRRERPAAPAPCPACGQPATQGKSRHRLSAHTSRLVFDSSSNSSNTRLSF